MLGTGILKGLYITAKNLVGSYITKERLTTIQYPEEPARIPENYRNFPFLVYDGDDPVSGLRCVACKQCENECPPQCIYIESEKDPVTKKARPKIFDLDISVCMGCGICVEICPFNSIKMDHVFEIATSTRYAELLLHRDQLSKSAEYHKKLHPTAATREAEEAETKKRDAEAKAAEAAAAKAEAAAAAAKATPAAPAASAAPAAAAPPP